MTKLLGELKADGKGVRELVAKMRKLLFEVETVAYSQQKFPGSDAFGGYCAEGVVPRDDKGGCKQKPTVDRAPLIANINGAVAVFDELIKVCES